jgi:hypothetical protein
VKNLQFEIFWNRLIRVVGFLGGLAIMVSQVIGNHPDRPWLYAAAIGMMGLPIARAAETVLSKFGQAGQPMELPNEQSPDAESESAK